MGDGECQQRIPALSEKRNVLDFEKRKKRMVGGPWRLDQNDNRVREGSEGWREGLTAIIRLTKALDKQREKGVGKSHCWGGLIQMLQTGLVEEETARKRRAKQGILGGKGDEQKKLDSHIMRPKWGMKLNGGTRKRGRILTRRKKEREGSRKKVVTGEYCNIGTKNRGRKA